MFPAFWNFVEFRTCLPPPFRCKETGQKHEKMHQIREFFFPLLSPFHFSRSWSEEFPSFFTSLAWHETQEKNQGKRTRDLKHMFAQIETYTKENWHSGQFFPQRQKEVRNSRGKKRLFSGGGGGYLRSCDSGRL